MFCMLNAHIYAFFVWDTFSELLGAAGNLKRYSRVSITTKHPTIKLFV